MDSSVSVPEHIDRHHVFDLDIYEDEGLLADLHARYARIQDEAPPIFWTPHNGGHWVAARFDVIEEIVRTPELFSCEIMQIPPVENAPSFIPLNLDPPESIPYRQILMPKFAPRSINAMVADMESLATDLVDSVTGKGECEFLGDIASRYPVGIFMKLMGLPMEKFDDFRKVVTSFFANQGKPIVVELSAQIEAELAQVIEARRAERRDDLISHLLDSDIKGRPLSQEELMSMSFLLFIAGLDTVTNGLTFGFHFLARRPDLQERLRNEPEKMGDAVEEVLRLFGVVNNPRIVAKDCEKFGVKFRKGEMLLNLLPMAGHDDTKNPDPETFDLDREKRQHLTFSTGPHLCIGHFLARAEMKALFAEWFSRVPEFRVADGFTPQYRAGTVMSLERLDLVWDAGKAG